MSKINHMLLAVLTCAMIGRNAMAAGPIIIRVSDRVEPYCVNSNSDSVWLSIRRVITEKRSGWFTTDKSLSLVVTTTVRTNPAADKPLSFPITAQATYADLPTGQISVPIEYVLVDGLALKQTNAKYTGLNVAVTLLNNKKRTVWGNALQAVNDILSSKKLPIPSSPIAEGASYLFQVANTAVQKDIDAVNTNDKAVSGSLDLTFAPTGVCTGDFEQTGTVAIVQPAMRDGDVDTSAPDSYCFSAEFRPTYILKAAPKKAGVACTDPSYSLQAVSNDYVFLVLNAVHTSDTLGGRTSKLLNDAISRCAANGISKADCLPSLHLR